MKKFIAACLLCLVYCTAFSQDAKQLVSAGVNLHDQGKYEEAIKSFDAAIEVDRTNYLAWYEKSYSLMGLKKYNESIDVLKYILKTFNDDFDNSSVYVNYGTCLDLLGKQKQAISKFDEGIKLYPTTGLLHYNKAITLINMQKQQEALDEIRVSISLTPYHASSHNFLSVAVAKQNKIQSLMSSLVFLAIEPKGNRAKDNLKNIETIISSGAKKTGDNAVTINLDMFGMMDKKEKEDDFHMIDMMLGLNAALDFDEKHKNETAQEKMQRKLETIFGMLGESAGNKKGFGWTHYAPFFSKLKTENHVETFSHIVYTSANNEENNKWLSVHAEKVELFNKWFNDYWTKN